MKSKIFSGLLAVYLSLFSIGAFSHSNTHVQPSDPLFTGLDSKPADVVSQFHHALKVGDITLVKSLLSSDVLIYESGHAERSSLEYASGHLLSDIKYLSSVQSELIEHQVKVNGNIAVSTSRSKIKKTSDGEVTEYISMETILVSKIDGKWLITHIHWS